MTKTQSKLYALALNALATLTLGGAAVAAFTQTASAAPAVPLTATPEAAKADVDYWCSRSGFEQDCEAAKKHLQVVMQAVSERKSEAKVKESNPQHQDVAKHNSGAASNDENRKALKQLRAQYLELYQKNQDLKKAKSALESKNSALNRKNRELKNQASQSCAVASQASNTVKNAIRPDIVPVSSELSGLGDSGASGVGEAAK